MREVLLLVSQRFGDNFGSLEEFGWPVNRADALRATRRWMLSRGSFARYWDDIDMCEEFIGPEWLK